MKSGCTAVAYETVSDARGVLPLLAPMSEVAGRNATLPFGLALANRGLTAALEEPHLRAGLNVYRGRLTYRAVAKSLGLRFAPIEQAAA